MTRVPAFTLGLMLLMSMGHQVSAVDGQQLNASLLECAGSQKQYNAILNELVALGKPTDQPVCIDQALKGCLAQQFVETQFQYWMLHQCQAFTSMFTDDFVYCDATLDPECIVGDKAYVEGPNLCGNTMVHEIHEMDLIVKPRMWPYDPNPATTCDKAPLYDDIIATGLQTVNITVAEGVFAYFCTDFAIAQKLVWAAGATKMDDIKSKEWKGYYTWTPGKCAWTARKGTLERMGALIANIMGKGKPQKASRIKLKTLQKAQTKGEL